MGVSHGNKKVTDNQLIALIDGNKHPVASAAELADELGMTRTGVTKRLNQMYENNLVNRKSVGSGYVWWVDSTNQD